MMAVMRGPQVGAAQQKCFLYRQVAVARIINMIMLSLAVEFFRASSALFCETTKGILAFFDKLTHTHTHTRLYFRLQCAATNNISNRSSYERQTFGRHRCN